MFAYGTFAEKTFAQGLRRQQVALFAALISVSVLSGNLSTQNILVNLDGNLNAISTLLGTLASIKELEGILISSSAFSGDFVDSAGTIEQFFVLKLENIMFDVIKPAPAELSGE